MTKQKESLVLHGGQAERFRELRDALEDELGYEPAKTRVVDELLRHYDGELLQ